MGACLLTFPDTAGCASRHEIARALAQAGIPVFPCRVNAKEPATAHGFQDATTDISQIDRWWSDADYNVAFEPEQAGLCVIDLDIKSGGPANWAAFTDDKPPTYMVETASGGAHLYYRGSLPPSASKLARGIDTRGRRSYVLAVGSIVDDLPYIANSAPIAELPAWVARSLAPTRQAVTASVEIDLPANIDIARARVRDLVKAGDVAREGDGGNDRTYRVATELINIGLSAERTAQMLREEWNAHCEPPWSDEEIETIVNNAWRYRQNEPGSWGRLDGTPQAWVDYAETQKPIGRFHLTSPSQAMQRTPPEYWDTHKLLLRGRGSVSLCYAAYSNFKTTWAANYSVAIAKATGCRVLYVLGEGLGGFGPLTLKALLESWNMDHPDNPISVDWLDAHLQIVERMPALLDDAQMIEFVECVKSWQPDIVWLDTLGNAAAGANLSAIEIGTKVGQQARYLAEGLHADLWLMHHRGKDGERATGSQYIAGNDPDMILALQHDRASSRLTVTVEKDRWGERERRVHFGTRLVDVGSGRLFAATHELPSQPANNAPLEDDARRVTRHVTERCAGGEMTGVTNSHEYGPAQMAHDLGMEQPYLKQVLTYARLRNYLKIDKSRGWCPGSVVPIGRDV